MNNAAALLDNLVGGLGDQSVLPTYQLDNIEDVNRILEDFYRKASSTSQREVASSQVPNTAGNAIAGVVKPTLTYPSMSKVLVRENEQTWMYYEGTRWQGKYAVIEWKRSNVINFDDFLSALCRHLYGVSSFVLGSEGTGPTVDYFLLLRSSDRFAWRDWRAKMAFGYRPGPFGIDGAPTLRVPLGRNHKQVSTFIETMLSRVRLCEYVRSYEYESMREGLEGKSLSAVC